MSEFDDMTVEVSDNMGADMPDTSDWAGFDFDGTDEVGSDITELPDATDASDLWTEL